MLPLGGIELGHKGFSLALIVEALTSGLAGHGRSEKPAPWSASVFLQLIDPDAFGGRDAFVREMQHLAEVCHDTPSRRAIPACVCPEKARWPAGGARFAKGSHFMRPSCRQ